MYNKLLKNLCLVLSTIIGLSRCISDGLYINNNIPKTKIGLESKPDKNIFYSDNYQSMCQRISEDNGKVLNLQTGKN
ncbi:hypothetical protein NAH07_11070, partial [Francisella tularensis subsp. holarctica]|nr:hypothetical protein [Francisella tularensis subsp. holarctica]